MHQKDVERFAFLYLCGQKDRAMLAGKKRMTFQDFDRLVYITEVLGFNQMNLEIWNRFSPQFKGQLEALEGLLKENYDDMEFREDKEEREDIQNHAQWFADFCDAVPDNEAREFLINIFDVLREEE